MTKSPLTRRQRWLAVTVSSVLLALVTTAVALGQGALIIERRVPAPPPGPQVPGKTEAVLVRPVPIDPAATPQAFGPYRLVPPGWVGELISERVQLPAGTKTADLAVIRRSPLFREVPAAVLPAGLRLVSGDTGRDADTESAIHLAYADAGGQVKLDVYRARFTERPWNVNYEDGGFTRAELLDGRYALITEWLTPPPLPEHAVQTRRIYETDIRMGVQNLEVLVVSQEYDARVLLEIAKTLVP